MNNAIITGGAGFIASHLAEQLESQFDTIYLVDNLVRTENLRNITHLLARDTFQFIEADVSTFDFDSLSGISTLYHLAATRINRCAKFPEEGHTFIAGGGFNVVRYCAENDVNLFFASTASVYNNPKRQPIIEEDPCEPHTIYGAGKYYTENLIRTFAKSHGLKYAICRFFSVYGERMDCEGAYTEIIYNWLSSIHEGGRTVTVFGNPDEKILDLVHVDDVVHAILTTTSVWPNDTYNVSTETGVSISKLIDTMERILEVELEINLVPENRTDIEKKRVGSVDKLRAIGWRPTHTLETGLIKTWEWIQT